MSENEIITNQNMPMCFQVAALTEDEYYAVRALRDGNADAYQQKLALQVIINKFSRPHDMPYDPTSERNSAFLSGRAFVGTRVLQILNQPIGKLNIVGDDNVQT